MSEKKPTRSGILIPNASIGKNFGRNDKRLGCQRSQRVKRFPNDPIEKLFDVWETNMVRRRRERKAMRDRVKDPGLVA